MLANLLSWTTEGWAVEPAVPATWIRGEGREEIAPSPDPLGDRRPISSKNITSLFDLPLTVSSVLR